MAAYFIGSIKSHDEAWVADYMAAVPALIGRHGGEMVCRSHEFVRY